MYHTPALVKKKRTQSLNHLLQNLLDPVDPRNIPPFHQDFHNPVKRIILHVFKVDAT
jgi:hypothetical protein